MKYAILGDWVEIEETILSPEERTSRLPEDTKKTPLKQWLKGNLLNEKAVIGDKVQIETLIGRTVTGELCDIRPRHTHDFGEYIQELMDVGIELRKEMGTSTNE